MTKIVSWWKRIFFSCWFYELGTSLMDCWLKSPDPVSPGVCSCANVDLHKVDWILAINTLGLFQRRLFSINVCRKTKGVFNSRIRFLSALVQRLNTHLKLTSLWPFVEPLRLPSRTKRGTYSYPPTYIHYQYFKVVTRLWNIGLVLKNACCFWDHCNHSKL